MNPESEGPGDPIDLGAATTETREACEGVLEVIDQILSLGLSHD